MYLVSPALCTKVIKSLRILAACKKVWQGKVEGCTSPSSPSSPNHGVMRSSLYEGLVLVDDLGSLSLLGASLSICHQRCGGPWLKQPSNQVISKLINDEQLL